MIIKAHLVVSVHYALSDEAGRTLDSSRERNMPLHYLQGHGNLMAGLEAALVGHQVGERVQVTLAPQDAYGARDETLIQHVARSAFGEATHLELGMSFQAAGPDGDRLVTVVAIDDEQVTLDANHPLAGKTLTYDVEILALRAATRAELAVGHPLEPSISHQDVEDRKL